MFAVIKTGGKQYKVAKNDIVTVEKLAAEVGSSVTLDDVLLVGGDGAPTVGNPGVAKAQVTAEVVDQGKGRTITVFKKKRRKNYRRANGHRQLNTVLKITDISLDGKKAADTDETKAKQASQKAGAKTQKQATQKATTEKSKSKSTTTAARSTKSTQAKAESKAKSGESKTAESKSAKGSTAKSGSSKSGQSKSTQTKSTKSSSAKGTASKSSGSKSASAKSGSSKSSTAKSSASKSSKSSGGSQAKKSEE